MPGAAAEVAFNGVFSLEVVIRVISLGSPWFWTYIKHPWNGKHSLLHSCVWHQANSERFTFVHPPIRSRDFLCPAQHISL